MTSRLKIAALARKRLFRQPLSRVTVAALLAILAGCSTASKTREQRAVHQVRSLALSTLHIRRPAAPSADPEAGSGGVDYESHPLPDPHFDCRPPRELFRGLDLRRVRDCLSKSSAEVELIYKLEKTTEPGLALQEDKKTPPCVARSLPMIPVPREIFYQGLDVNGAFGCFASGIRSEEDRWIGAKLLASKLKVPIDLPLTSPPRDDDETVRLLLSWALAPYKGPATDLIRARVVPEDLCRACIGDENYISLPLFSRIPLWP